MSPHFSFDDETNKKLEDFSKQRGRKKSPVLRAAFELMIATEHPDPGKQAIIRTVIDRWFTVPKHIPVFSFYSFLYLLSFKYPNESSNTFWGENVYLSDQPRTHRELKNQIDDEIKRMLAMQKKKDTL